MCCESSLLHELFCQAEFHSLVVTRVTRDWVEQYKSLHPLKSDFSTLRGTRCFGWGETLSMDIDFTLQRKGMCVSTL